MIFHESPVQADGWEGYGYVISDDLTGASAFKIAGGANGAFMSGVLSGISGSLAFMLTGMAASPAAPEVGVAAGTAILMSVATFFVGTLLIMGRLLQTKEEFDCFVGGYLLSMKGFGIIGTLSFFLRKTVAETVGLLVLTGARLLPSGAILAERLRLVDFADVDDCDVWALFADIPEG